MRLSKRLIIVLTCSIIAAILFAIVPGLNILGYSKMALWKEMSSGSHAWMSFFHWLLQTLLFFFALVFLIAFQPKPRAKNKPEEL